MDFKEFLRIVQTAQQAVDNITSRYSGTLTCTICGKTEPYTNMSWVPKDFMCMKCLNEPPKPAA